ncbi:MAG: polysaccharide deacetylase family protein [Alistipes sp.]|nr:polysaccharide deacetylase family protein [Alistipes sp.]
MKITPPKFIRKMLPDLVWQIEDDRGVYLTFDDGPTPGVTEWILAMLKRYDAKATFFVLGKNVERYPDLYAKIIADGHQVGNHTYSHQKGYLMSLERYLEDIDLASYSVHSNLFRPPYARVTPSQLRAVAQHYKIVMWSIISRDYNRKISGEMCWRGVGPHIKAGAIILFHDSEKSFANMSYALPKTLERIAELGLKCKAIEL